MRASLTLLTALAACGVLACADRIAAADEASAVPGPFHHIAVLDVEGMVEPMMRAYLERRLEAARAAGVDLILLRVDSNGGRLDSAKEIADLVAGVPDDIHVLAWVPEKAISAAAYISLAADEIVMAEGASLGDCQPIIPSADGAPTRVGEKVESPLRAWFRTLAQANGYPVLLSEAMVTSDLEILRVRSLATGENFYVRAETYRQARDGDVVVADPEHLKEDLQQVGDAVSSKGELLTLTAEEAREYGFIHRAFPDGLPRDEEALLAQLKAEGAQVVQMEMTFGEDAGRVLLQVAGVLSAVVFLAVMMLLFQGPGIMTIVGGVALIVMLLIYATVQHLHGFPLFLILLGALLLAAEVFLIPGFGVAGILGFLSMGAGFLMLAGGITLDDTGRQLTQETALDFGLQFVATAIAGFVVLLLLGRLLPTVGPAKRMRLAAPDGGSDALSLAAAAALPALGARGTAATNLRPAGTARFGDEIVDVISDGGYVPAGAPLVVVQVEGSRVRVAHAAEADA